jgi:hypothetical protein
MIRLRDSVPAVIALTLAFVATDAHAQDESIAVADGGISVPGWTGKIDAREAEQGQVLENASFAMDGEAIHIKTGPAVTYWNSDNEATGDYTVSATFTEPAYMAMGDHPHPYGLIVGGRDLGTDQQSFLYCSAYGNGSFIVRGFGPEPFQLSGRRPTAHDAVNKAAGPDEPVVQQIAVDVRGETVSCSINGSVVASYDRSEVVADGRLKSTDGLFGIRMGHNTEARVTDLSVSH